MSSQRLLILNGSLSELPLIKKAKELGYYVITSGNAPELIGHRYADEYIPADYSDKEAILQLVKDNAIDRIVSPANDFGVISACYVAQTMGWPGHDTYQNALTLHHKDAFKMLIQEMGIRTPHSVVFHSKDEALDGIDDFNYPVIVKAVDLTGGKGIHRANNREEAIAAIENAYSISRSNNVVVEPCLTGVQQSIDTFVRDGKVIASVSNDCYMPMNPYLIQSETLPARGIEDIQDELHGIIEAICKRLSLVDGMFTLQYIICDGKPYVIEMMRRCLGNQFLTVAGRVTGFPWEEALLRAETGMPLDGLTFETPKSAFAGHHGVMGDHNGKIAGYRIDPELQDHLFQTIEIMQPGEEITNFMNERVAYLYYEADTRQEIESFATRLNSLAYVVYAE